MWTSALHDSKVLLWLQHRFNYLILCYAENPFVSEVNAEMYWYTIQYFFVCFSNICLLSFPHFFCTLWTEHEVWRSWGQDFVISYLILERNVIGLNCEPRCEKKVCHAPLTKKIKQTSQYIKVILTFICADLLNVVIQFHFSFSNLEWLLTWLT